MQNKASNIASALKVLYNLKEEADFTNCTEVSSAIKVAIDAINKQCVKKDCSTCEYRDANKDAAPCRMCYLASSYTDNYVQRDLKFDQWVQELTERVKNEADGVYCIHGGLSGGPGYLGFASCDLHPEVRYGCKDCDGDCKDFDLVPIDKLKSLYHSLHLSDK